MFKQVRRSYSREKKIEVLLFLTHHRIPINPGSRTTEYRHPSHGEAAGYFKIPKATIHGWWQEQEKIVLQRGMTYRVENTRWICEWPEMEEELFNEFIEKRQAGRVIGRGWFRRTARRLFCKHYGGDNEGLFVFSNGWFLKFQKRWRISSRAITKTASRLPDEYRQLVINWLRFNRRNSQPRNFLEREHLITDIGCYPASRILNLDETPIPFEYLNGRTYDLVGSKTVAGKTDRSGWDKRQATLILYIFSDGIPRIKPKLIFHGKTGDNIRKQEGHLWNSGVTVEFNPTAYNNEDLFLQFIDQELFPALNIQPVTAPNPQGLEERSLLVMDVASFHKTPTVLSKLQESGVTVSLIPGGCTGLLQPLDTALNKPFKQYLQDFTERYVDERVDIETWSVSDKRVMVTHVVAQAWNVFCQEKRLLIQKSFQDVGLTLPLDGTQDHKLRIKGFDRIEVGDWRQDLAVPACYHEGQDYRALPLLGREQESDANDGNGNGQDNSEPEFLEFFWQCEEYHHERLQTGNLQFEPGGSILST